MQEGIATLKTVTKMTNIKNLTEAIPMSDATAQPRMVAKMMRIKYLTETPTNCRQAATTIPRKMMDMTGLMRMPSVCGHLTQECRAQCQVRLAMRKP